MKHSTAKDRAWKAFSIFIRTRDCIATTKGIEEAKCFTCPRVRPFKLLDAGHLQGGRHNKYLFDEVQVNAQCKYCNGTLQGNGAIYYKNLVKKLGSKVVDALLEENKEILQYKVWELLELERVYKDKTMDLLLNR